MLIEQEHRGDGGNLEARGKVSYAIFFIIPLAILLIIALIIIIWYYKKKKKESNVAVIKKEEELTKEKNLPEQGKEQINVQEKSTVGEQTSGDFYKTPE